MGREQPLVMIVDDDAGIRNLLHGLFTKNGFAVIAAKDTNSALELLQTNHPDLIITDLMMPQAGGVIFIQQVKDLAKFKAPPIIVFSGLTSGLGQTAKVAGAVRILRKPDDLVILIEEALNLIRQ